jgi:hypothetical protein
LGGKSNEEYSPEIWRLEPDNQWTLVGGRDIITGMGGDGGTGEDMMA